MIKLVFFRINKGDSDSGFNVTVRVEELGSSDRSEFDGSLPQNPEISKLYEVWKSHYSRVDKNSRGKGGGKPFNPKTVVSDCREASQKLIKEINNWLGDSGNSQIQRLREKLSRALGSEKNEVRVFIQTENEMLQKLPWHEWDFFSQIYTRAETVLSPLEVQPENPPPARGKSKVRILAILGNSEGIEVSEDQELLDNLPDADVNFLVEPKQEKLSASLWGQDWDILFFAGHSDSDNNSGNISINPNDTISLEELKNGLRKAIQSGLQLAIFNSCDGLQLAKDLADLRIPQTIVMREEVPDTIAQAFLKYFLSAFSSGKSVYLAVREARERLHDDGLDADFPGAAWLPVIYQNPGWNPPTWQEFVFSPGTWKLVHKNTLQCRSVLSFVIKWYKDRGGDWEAWKNGNPVTFSVIKLLDDRIRDWRNWANRTTMQVGINLTFSPDGKYLACASEEKIDLLSTLNGQSVLEFLDEMIPIDEINVVDVMDTFFTETWFTAVAISPDDRLLVGVGHNKIRIWHRETGEQLHSCPKKINPIWWFFDHLCLDAVAFSPDGQILAINDENNINFWNPETGQRLHQLSGHTELVTSLAFSPDGKILVSGSYDRTIRLWNVRTRKQLGHPLEVNDSVYTVAFSRDGQYIASGSKNNKIILWPFYSDESPKIFTGHSKEVLSVAFSPDSKILASGSADGTIRIWKVSTGELVEELPEKHERGVTSVAFSPDGQYIASGDRDLTVRIWQRE